MPRGGYRPNAGSKPGQPKRKTIERLARAEERVAQAKARGEKLAVDVLRELMNTALGYATLSQPLPPDAVAPKGHKADPELFWRAAGFAKDCAVEIMQTETPKLRAIVVGTPPTPLQMSGGFPILGDGKVIDLVANENDPGKLSRVYQHLIGGQRRLPRATS